MIDIHSKCVWPAAALSNFAPHAFIFDGIKCGSMEGFLQGLKFESQEEQKAICLLVGIKAKRQGKKMNWQQSQLLFWKGKAIQRESVEYQQLLNTAFRAMFQQCMEARKALLATGNEVIAHSIGRSDPKQTVLTEQEFCSILMNIRAEIQK